MRRLPNAALGALGLAGFLVVVELVPRTGLVIERSLPPASKILAELGRDLNRRSFWTAVGDTLTAWAVGLAIAFAAAVVLGFLIGMPPWLRRATVSTIEFLRLIPSVALIPLAVLIFGTRLQSSLLLIVYASFWQVLLQVLAGVADVDPVATGLIGVAINLLVRAFERRVLAWHPSVRGELAL